MNSFDCDRISARASARSFDAAVTRPTISACTFAPPFRPNQLAGAGKGTQAGQGHGPTHCGGGLVGLIFCQPVPTKSFRASHEYQSADQLRSGK